jgi:indolepyruvate ferredoxin oxidoreductase
VLPGWHSRERDFRDWFESLVPRVDWVPEQGPRAYQKWISILELPQQATGYREVRYPKMELVRRRVTQLLATDVARFEPAPSVVSESVEPELAVV